MSRISIALLLAIGVAAPLECQEYVPSGIEPLTGQTHSRACGINDVGRVVGRSSDYDVTSQQAVGRTPIVWDAVGGTRALPVLGGEGSAWGLSNSGQASGFSHTVSGQEHAVRWDAVSTTPTVLDLGTLTNTTTGQAGETSTAYDLNDPGAVSGYSEIPNDDGSFVPFHATVYTDAGGLQDLGTFDADFPEYQNGYSISYSVNADGQAVGLAHDTSTGS